jgi:hypothetical protein
LFFIPTFVAPIIPVLNFTATSQAWISSSFEFLHQLIFTTLAIAAFSMPMFVEWLLRKIFQWLFCLAAETLQN